MKAPLATPDLARIQPVKAVSVDYRTLPKSWFERRPSFQYGGPAAAWATLNSFLEQRGRAYHYSISQPIRAQHHCSRLSPYLAWGNLSLRDVIKRQSVSAVNRMETATQWMYRAFTGTVISFKNSIRRRCNMPLNRLTKLSLPLGYRSEHLKAWQQKRATPWSMRQCACCSKPAIIFMRALLVSFLCYIFIFAGSMQQLTLPRCFLI